MPDREPLYVLTTDDPIRFVQDTRSGAADDPTAYVDSRAVHCLTTHDATGRTSRPRPRRGRGREPQTVTGTGPDEAAALRDLVDQLRGVDDSNGTRLEEFRQRLRLAYVEGAEGWARGDRRARASGRRVWARRWAVLRRIGTPSY